MIDYTRLVENLAHPKTREAARQALEAADHDASEALRRGLSHRDPQVRKWCAALLDHAATAACVPDMIAALEDPMADVRRLAVHSIGCQECKQQELDLDVVALLIRQLERDPSVKVRRVCAHMLGNQPPDTRAREVLERFIETECDAKTLRNAEWALSQHQPDPHSWR